MFTSKDTPNKVVNIAYPCAIYVLRHKTNFICLLQAGKTEKVKGTVREKVRKGRWILLLCMSNSSDTKECLEQENPKGRLLPVQKVKNIFTNSTGSTIQVNI